MKMFSSLKHLSKPTSDLTSRFMSSQVKTAIVMLNMGGPQHVDQVHGYLHRIMTDRDMMQLPFQNTLGPYIARRRTSEVQKKYAEIGGGSPILKWTNLQGKLMCEKLDKISPSTAPHKHYVAFRYVEPLTESTFEQVQKDGADRVVLFSQYPQYSCATSGSSFNAIYSYFQNKTFPENLKLSIIDRWATHPLLIKAIGSRISDEIKQFPESDRDDVVVLFSAHSLPLKAVNRGDAYPSEVSSTVHAVMEELGYAYPYALVWQSKVGPLPWLGPFTDDALKGYVKQGKKNFILVPIAFVNEHIETLHELDIEYCKELGEELGVKNIRRAAAPNDHPLFIDGIADIVSQHLRENKPVSPKFLLRCAHCISSRCYESKQWFSSVCKSK
ncbi:ferrochelatase, mitochondrial [Metopolophium dirhodum]|uniref:ferrochelatase, mitochondrial n=1 Tax=Metopolophium dirhodum TaxID=44670 RepID=UPI002990292E|nr:ferrochelatase, mitochondrial [Metopolophium dirhodum]